MIKSDVQGKKSIAARDLHERLAAGEAAELLDLRTPAEYSEVHIAGTRSIPLDELNPAECLRRRGAGSGPVYLICELGGRAVRAAEKFRQAGFPDCVVLEGGTRAWIDAGLPVERGPKRILPLMRQVQITVGSISALGAALALTISSWFALIPLVLGCGLLFAGISGTCGLALVLARMPWNRVACCHAHSCCETKGGL